ncbi:alcohol dehydrogenase, putative [Perkinsus marinus ATCC 50983]|uniref:Alcohol dehydrogenase, putative n=1 Tax=Perkinsus marinus (strain ATCC 50983 / TXsc) TaxID=423536 RepID=C5KLU2_PERM5|nr:alcohol dehydrogenase, putative [Perkinsus marinus ATCC 50983]EER14551.1 alcohol dehydrogenase, putative [Perkinsus marinus ATCC 50983]|eukprot:XP_002782756.1 alcohol dehydrogenase, putative [Perkinsus marinus ATCC 50983]
MKAFTYANKAGEMVWHDGDLKIPKPGRSQVQVKVLAVGINPLDYKLPMMVPFSSYLLRGRPAGFDFAGKVTVPNGDFNEGDVVYGVTMKGALAEYTTADTSRIARVPDGMDHTTAAGLATAGDTALLALRKAGISESTRNVLIIGASGGVGCMGVQIAKSLGAKVWGVCSGKNEEFVKSLGADEVVDYTKSGFAFPNKQCPTGSVDVVFDTVSSPEDMNYEPLARKSMKAGDGKYISTNSPSRIDLARAILSSFSPFNLQRSGYYMVTADARTEDLATLADMVVKGALKVPIQEILPFNEEGCRKAFDLQKSRRVRGKVVIDMNKS